MNAIPKLNSHHIKHAITYLMSIFIQQLKYAGIRRGDIVTGKTINVTRQAIKFFMILSFL